nr:uncharacterized protein LOC111749888 [Loxodonta africana]
MNRPRKNFRKLSLTSFDFPRCQNQKGGEETEEQRLEPQSNSRGARNPATGAANCKPGEEEPRNRRGWRFPRARTVPSRPQPSSNLVPSTRAAREQNSRQLLTEARGALPPLTPDPRAVTERSFRGAGLEKEGKGKRKSLQPGPGGSDATRGRRAARISAALLARLEAGGGGSLYSENSPCIWDSPKLEGASLTFVRRLESKFRALVLREASLSIVFGVRSHSVSVDPAFSDALTVSLCLFLCA